MKKRIIKISAILCLMLVLTGCTKTLTTKNSDGKKVNVQNPETGQALTSNILCQPSNPKLIEIYEKNNVDINALPKCEDFSITSGGYDGSLWTTVFVKPLAWVIIKIGAFVKSYGLALIIITILLRLILYPLTRKAAMQSENLALAKPELEILEKKYQNRQDQESMMQKSQEMLMIYKKYKINPMSGCLFSLLNLPLFLAFLEAINRLPAIFEETFIGFQLGTTTWTGFMHGHWYYIIVVILVIVTTYFSFKLNSGASMSPEQAKQMKMMTNIMILIISFTSLTLASGIAVYWITNSAFTIVQNLIVKMRRKKDVANI